MISLLFLKLLGKIIHLLSINADLLACTTSVNSKDYAHKYALQFSCNFSSVLPPKMSPAWLKARLADNQSLYQIKTVVYNNTASFD